MTTIVARAIIEPIQLTAADVTLYTAPANTRTIIDKFTATNETAVAATLTVNLVQAAGSVSATNTIIAVQSIPALSVYLCPEITGHVLNPGDYISAKASVITALSVRSSGREVS